MDFLDYVEEHARDVSDLTDVDTVRRIKDENDQWRVVARNNLRQKYAAEYSAFIKQHGGPRRPRPGKSLGRNPLSDEPTEKHTITAPASFWRYLENLCTTGNRSKAFRLLVEYHHQNAK